MVTGEFEQPSPGKQKLITLIQATQFVLIGSLFVQIPATLTFIPLPLLDLLNGLKDSKMYSGLAIFFIGNLLASSLGTTNAFEVYVNGALVFSKLKTGGLPHSLEILINQVGTALSR